MSESIAGRTVFVTGADGFIGSHLVELLVASGARVRALVFYNSWNEKGWLRDVPVETLNEIELLPGDIRDTERVRQGVKDCEYVFHLSSLVAIPYSYDAPRSDRKSTRLNSSHLVISYAVFCLKKKTDTSADPISMLSKAERAPLLQVQICGATPYRTVLALYQKLLMFTPQTSQ